LSVAYPGKFQTDDEKGDYGFVNVWLDLLKDIDPKCLIQATRQLASQPGQWPPTVGEVRSLAVDLSMGEYAPVSEFEAWERALRVSIGEPIVTSEEEKRALNMIGGTWQIKHSENLSFDRRAFVSHYSELIKRKKRIDSALPEVKQIANLNAPALPPKPTAPSNAPIEESEYIDRMVPEPERKPATREEVRELLKGYRFHSELDLNHLDEEDQNKKKIDRAKSVLNNAGLIGDY
jgi:hypothetical protein